jgi:hypothetical protein
MIRRMLFASAIAALAVPAVASAQSKEEKARFYDFSDQLIDGEIKKPTALFVESRSRARFNKLLKLKKSFRPAMIETSKERILK